MRRMGRNIRSSGWNRVGILLVSASLVLVPISLSRAAASCQPGLAEVQLQNQPVEQQVERMLSIAEAQHDIVKLLIKQGRFDQVMPEMRKIYDLNLPERFELNIAQSASLIADLLVQSKQSPLAHEVLNEAFTRMKDDKNRVSILKIQAYVYKSEGKLEDALATLKRAVAIEERQTRP